MDNNITRAIKVFKDGRIVVFPTDTVVGIGCRMDFVRSVKRVFEIKKRSLNDALLVLVDSVEMAEKYVKIPKEVKEKLVDKYWPGGLSLFFKTKSEKVPRIVTANTDILAVRMPNHADIRNIIKEVGVPIIATSANISGLKTPLRIEDVNKKITEKVDFVLNGICTYKKESTIVDTTVTPWKIIRDGAIKIKI